MKRFNPFNGIQVSLFDATYWTGETASAVKQRINSDLYNKGVVNGLTVFESGTRAGTAAFTSGVAYDPNGERIGVGSLTDQVAYSGALLNDTAVYTIVLSYQEGNDGTSGLDVDGASNFRHITDGYTVRTLKSGVDSAGANDVSLAQVYSSVNGGSLIFNTNVRDTFSAKFSAAAGGTASGGNLSLGGSLSVGGCATFYLGVTLVSPDGTKQARVGVGNDGSFTFEPLNYTL